jgi:tRNA nucleotidyltransferase (CCA-adding enzyme)
MVNRLKTLSKEFKKILKATSLAAESIGFSIYLVGGVVRDLLLRKDIFDLDIVVEGDAAKLAERLAKDLGGTFNRHHAFGTATVIIGTKKIDFATARVEHYSRSGALPKVSPASLEDDLFRRDFTINAMAISLNKKDYGRLIDIYSGLKDLKNGTLCVLHEKSFLDDPTRILRALRFEQRFAFSFSADTSALLAEALNKKALNMVSDHRLGDELVLILKEPRPRRYIKRIDKLLGFSFIDRNLRLKIHHYSFLLRLEKIVKYYQGKYKNQRDLQAWVIYLAAIVVDIQSDTLSRFFHDFAFRKGERIIIHSIKNNLKSIKTVNKAQAPSKIYKALSDFSFEALVFFYAYYPLKQLRKNIDNFLSSYIHVKIKVKGKDLKALGLKPEKLYGEVFKKLLYSKLDQGFKYKRDELRQAKLILNEILKSPKPENILRKKRKKK